MASVTYAVLAREDDKTTAAVLPLLKGCDAFAHLSAVEGAAIQQRDAEDEEKLAVGINIAIEKKVISSNPNVADTIKIDVVGKCAEAVAAEIVGKLPAKTGNVVVLQGLSGTGKGTTVKKLQSHLDNCVCWSNGNVFRSITHLLAEEFPQGSPFPEEAITAERISKCVSRMDFCKVNGEFDVVIDGALRVSTIQNTLLKRPIISQRVPTVAKYTQGEVIQFGAVAVDILKSAGCNVILEGRAQTLNYIPTPLRFELIIPDIELLGQRRAAQRVVAAALSNLTPSATDDETTAAVLEAAKSL